MELETLAGKLVLVIDDDEAIRDSIAAGLKELSEGVEVVTAPDAATGLRRARERPPHVVVLDLQMPLGNGFSFVDELKNDAHLRGVKILMLTANASTKNEWASIDHDIDDFMAKPFDLIELEGRLRSLLTKPFGSSRRI